jgi:hypothetical protein
MARGPVREQSQPVAPAAEAPDASERRRPSYYAFSQDLPFSLDVFRRFKAAVPDDDPPGLISRVVFEIEDGVRLIEVWETEADRARFIEQSVRPVVEDDGFFAGTGYQPPKTEPPRNELNVLDIWTTQEYRSPV